MNEDLSDEEEKAQFNLSRYRQHKRTIPWGLIRKIVIVLVLLGLLYLFQQRMTRSKEDTGENQNEIEIEVVD